MLGKIKKTYKGLMGLFKALNFTIKFISFHVHITTVQEFVY